MPDRFPCSCPIMVTLRIFVFFFSAHVALAAFDKYSPLVIADPPGSKQPPGNSACDLPWREWLSV